MPCPARRPRLLLSTLLLAVLAAVRPAAAEDSSASADEIAAQKTRERREAKIRDFGPGDRLRDRWTQGETLLAARETGDPDHGPALVLPAAFPDATEIWLGIPAPLVDERPADGGPPLALSRIAYSLFVPAQAGGRIQAALLLKDKDGLFYEATAPAPLRPGCWNRLEADLSDESLVPVPRGHTKRWSLDALTTIQHIGFAVWGSDTFRGELYLDDIATWPDPLRSAASEHPLSIINLVLPQSPIPQYGCFECSFELNRPILNPFDQDRVRVDALIQPPDSGETIVVPAFYYQDYRRIQEEPCDRYEPAGPGAFRIRFTPRLPGAYRFRLKAVYQPLDDPGAPPETCEGPEQIFRVAPRLDPGFVRVSETDRRYFEFENGDFFFPIGHNFRSPYDLRDWEKVEQQKNPHAPPPADRGLDIYEEYVPKIASSGENLLEVWMCSWWLALEWTPRWKGYHGLGRYNLENAWKLDALLDLCQQNGIRIHLVVDNHGKASMEPQVDHEWEFSPYSRADGNGGFLDHPLELFGRDERVERNYRNLFRYIAARWGYSRTIFGIELWSELDLIGNRAGRHRDVYATAEVRDWHQRMAQYLRRLDHGRHLITTHYSGDFNTIDWEMARLPEIDYIACDAYHGQNRPLVNLLVNTDRAARAYGKPYMVTEFGGNPFGGTWEELEGDLHAGLWTSWMTNAGGGALFWWFVHIDRANLYPHFRAFANYIAGEDKRRPDGASSLEPASLSVTLDGQPTAALTALGTGNDEIIYAWIHDPATMMSLPPMEKRPLFHTAGVALQDPHRGKHAIECWDTYAGTVVKQLEADAGSGTLQVALPPFRGDIALKIRRLTRSSAPASEPSPPPSPPAPAPASAPPPEKEGP